MSPVQNDFHLSTKLCGITTSCVISLLAPFVNTFSMIFTSLTPSLQIERSLENLTKNTKQATKKIALFGQALGKYRIDIMEMRKKET